MKKYFHLLFVLIVLFGIFLWVPDLIAQPPPPALPAKPTQNPIDGGLAILAVAGGAYAIKKLRDKKE